MRTDIYNLEAPQAIDVGAPLVVEPYTDKTVSIGGAFVATLHIDGSLDGTNWDAITNPIATKEIISIPHTLKKIRVSVTAYTSGQPVVKFAGRLTA